MHAKHAAVDNRSLTLDHSALLPQRILALAGLGLTLAAALVIDRLSLALFRSAAQSLLYTPAMLMTSVANLALALAVLTLVVWISARARRDPFVAAVYLGVGALCLLLPVLGVAFQSSGWLADLRVALSPDTRLAYTAALLAAAGLLHATRQISPRRRKDRQENQAG